jgi:hypothetical protein
MALSFSAFAGDILTPGATQPPPKTSTTYTASATTATCNSDPGDILTPGAAVNPVTEATLSLLESLLSLF